MILPSRSVTILFGTDANLRSATSSAHRRTLNSCCSAKDLIAKITVLGVPIASGQKPTLSRRGIGLSQRAQTFAVEFPFDIEAVLAVGVDVRVTRWRQMCHIGLIHGVAFRSQLI